MQLRLAADSERFMFIFFSSWTVISNLILELVSCSGAAGIPTCAKYEYSFWASTKLATCYMCVQVW